MLWDPGTEYSVMLCGGIVYGMINSRRGGRISFKVCLKFMAADVVTMLVMWLVV